MIGGSVVLSSTDFEDENGEKDSICLGDVTMLISILERSYLFGLFILMTLGRDMDLCWLASVGEMSMFVFKSVIGRALDLKCFGSCDHSEILVLLATTKGHVKDPSKCKFFHSLVGDFFYLFILLCCLISIP